MVDQYLAGKSVMAIARWLEEQGALTVGGNPWTSTTVRNILFSARIAGIREHRGELQTKAVWKPIITTEKRALILAEKDRRAVSGRRGPRRYLLSGLLRCSHCEGKLYAQPREYHPSLRLLVEHRSPWLWQNNHRGGPGRRAHRRCRPRAPGLA